jgi:tetratricopeptide (TPR) repeat protein
LLADTLNRQFKGEEAEKILKHLLALNESKHGQQDLKTLDLQLSLVRSSLVSSLFYQRRYSEAEAMARSVLPIMKETLGEDSSIALTTLNLLSIALNEQGKWAGAKNILSELITKTIIKNGKHHPDVLISLCSYANSLIRGGNLDEAERILREVLEVEDRVLGSDHAHTILTNKQLEFVTHQQELQYSTTHLSANPPSPFAPPTPLSNDSSHPKPRRGLDRLANWALLLPLIPKWRSPRLEIGVESNWKSVLPDSFYLGDVNL